VDRFDAPSAYLVRSRRYLQPFDVADSLQEQYQSNPATACVRLRVQYKLFQELVYSHKNIYAVADK
jgi:hypothetical protein